MKNNNNYFNNYHVDHAFKVVSWLTEVYKTTSVGRVRHPNSYLPLLHKIDKILTTRGKEFTILWIKDLRLNYLKFLAGEVTSSTVVKLRSGGLPSLLGPFYDDDIFNIRILNTILHLTRGLRLQSSLNVVAVVTAPETLVQHYIDGNSEYRSHYSSTREF